jgi:membrane protein YqaA with SNARE-associated domain
VTDSQTELKRRPFQWGIVLPRAGAFLLALGITLAVIVFREDVARFSRYGLMGVFVVSALSNATLILPVPGLALVFAAGSALPPWQVGIVAGLGGAVGELTGYLAGYGGSMVIENRERYEHIKRHMQRYGLFTILVLSVIPNPFFDLAGIAAGALRLPLWQFLAVAAVGKTIKALVVAYAGAGSMSFLDGWLAS